MKVGILTFHRAINYGGILQCYALYTTLEKLGCDVEIIDYRPESIEHDRSYFVYRDFKSKNIIQKIVYLLSCLAQIFSRKRVISKFDAFIQDNFNLSDIAYKGDDIKNNYDIIFFGSDQIWSLEMCFKLDEVYFGQFPKRNAKFITYAASAGKLEYIKGRTHETFGNYLNAFDRISVREKSLYDFIINESHIGAEITCDPSLLCTRSFYESMTHNLQEKDYVLLILMKPSKQKIEFTKRIAEQLNAKVIRIYGLKNPLIRSSVETRSELAPSDFLSYIRYAKCVITDSFHGTSFSIIMHTNFYTLRRKTNNDRAETLLDTIGLKERMVDINKECIYQDIEFSHIDEKIEEYRNHSIQFITNSLYSD